MSRIIRTFTIIAVAAGLAIPAWSRAQEASTPSGQFDEAVSSIQRQLEEALAELSAVRSRIAEEKIPLNKELRELESELTEVRRENRDIRREFDSQVLDVSNLKKEIESRENEASYLAGLLGDYIRNFQSRIHIAELQNYRGLLDEARLAAENTGLPKKDLFEAQAEVVVASLDRLDEMLAGMRFNGTGLDSEGIVRDGTFVLVGPSAIFRSSDGDLVGTAEQRLQSLEPSILAFSDPLDEAAAAQVITSSSGNMPLDPTLGNAHVIATSQDTILEHIAKGGPVMYPIFGLAGAAFLVAIFKFIGLVAVGSPSNRRVNDLLRAVARNDQGAAQQVAKEIRGPAGEMLQTGVEHLEEPRELIEEAMYERVLSAKLKLQRMLPFIAISAAAAPLLGLLGTVTGIINTFKLITVFGTGDVKTLSGGISEALITTEFGLIVAIPSLLLHAFLSRKAKGITDEMEKVAIAFLNQVGRARPRRVLNDLNEESTFEQPELGSRPQSSSNGDAQDQVREILIGLLGPVVRESLERRQTVVGHADHGADDAAPATH